MTMNIPASLTMALLHPHIFYTTVTTVFSSKQANIPLERHWWVLRIMSHTYFWHDAPFRSKWVLKMSLHAKMGVPPQRNPKRWVQRHLMWGCYRETGAWKQQRWNRCSGVKIFLNLNVSQAFTQKYLKQNLKFASKKDAKKVMDLGTKVVPIKSETVVESVSNYKRVSEAVETEIQTAKRSMRSEKSMTLCQLEVETTRAASSSPASVINQSARRPYQHHRYQLLHHIHRRQRF